MLPYGLKIAILNVFFQRHQRRRRRRRRQQRLRDRAATGRARDEAPQEARDHERVAGLKKKSDVEEKNFKC